MERDLPINHPNASDYNGEPWNPPRAPYGEDFPEGHPARDGANVSQLDTPDGTRAALLAQRTDFVELAAVGALPPLIDPAKDRAVDLDPKTLAMLYELRKGLVADVDQPVIREDIMLALVAMGYERDAAGAMIDGYCVPVSQK